VQGYNDDLTFTSTTALENGSWHFIVVTTNGTSATVYVDGTSLGTQSFTTTLDTIPEPQGLQIGAGTQGCCGAYSGDLADIAIFPSALTAAQVTAEWTASGDTARSRSHSHPLVPAHKGGSAPRQGVASSSGPALPRS
jgi:hypothetical protein